ncbi:MAG: rRNA pseudouridine synthase [Myxococcales bacterium]|nr:rRNA pseudouridine synthase [Myxococcales bacterium]
MTIRLDKLLVDRGMGSRKEVRKLVKKGLVEVDGVVNRHYDGHVDPGAVITIEGVEVEALPEVVVWHKPVGVVSSTHDDHGRSDLSDALPGAWAGKLHPVGRLDAETSGLLLFSLEGKVTQWLLHPRRAVERSYVAIVEGRPEGAALAARMAGGVETAEGTFTARVDGVEGAVVRLTVTEGKHRMVRRMLANAGHPVLELTRVRYGGFELGELMPGESRAASAEELAWLRSIGAPGI